MTQGVILLSKDGYYLSEDGRLPGRPSWDKEFITGLVKGKIVLCSANTLKDLPKSIIDAAAHITLNGWSNYDINFGISTFNTNMPDQLIVVRSKEYLLTGKKFSLIGWTNIYKGDDIEIYV
jgi:hypothetical protein